MSFLTYPRSGRRVTGTVAVPRTIDPNGPVGEKGITGPRGPRGPPGPIGDKGREGERGETGPEGVEGPEGPPGINGPRGPEGIQGPPGPTLKGEHLQNLIINGHFEYTHRADPRDNLKPAEGAEWACDRWRIVRLDDTFSFTVSRPSGVNFRGIRIHSSTEDAGHPPRFDRKVALLSQHLVHAREYEGKMLTVSAIINCDNANYGVLIVHTHDADGNDIWYRGADIPARAATSTHRHSFSFTHYGDPIVVYVGILGGASSTTSVTIDSVALVVGASTHSSLAAPAPFPLTSLLCKDYFTRNSVDLPGYTIDGRTTRVVYRRLPKAQFTGLPNVRFRVSRQPTAFFVFRNHETDRKDINTEAEIKRAVVTQEDSMAHGTTVTFQWKWSDDANDDAYLADGDTTIPKAFLQCDRVEIEEDVEVDQEDISVSTVLTRV